MYKVYTHTTPDGMVYVGVTGRKYLSQRWRPILYKGTTLEPYIEKFGWKAIKHEVIYTCEDRDEAYKVEEEMRQYYEERGCCINKQRSGLIKAKDENTYYRQLYQDNPEYREKHKELCRQYSKDNREKLGEYNRKYQQDHRKEIAEYQRQWRAKKKAEKLLQSGQIEIPIAV